MVYAAQGKFVEAEPLYKRALIIIEKALGPERPTLLTILENYAAMLRLMNKPTEAVPLENRATAIRAKQAQASPTK